MITTKTHYRHQNNGTCPASPFIWDEVNDNVTNRNIYPGLTKREHFAGLAMQGLLASECVESFYAPAELVKRAIESADALLAALESPK